jgi:hypothetical protein
MVSIKTAWSQSLVTKPCKRSGAAFGWRSLGLRLSDAIKETQAQFELGQRLDHNAWRLGINFPLK